MSRAYAPLDDRLREVEDAIALCWRRTGRGPRRPEIARRLEISEGRLERLLSTLVEQGRVLTPGKGQGGGGYQLPADAEAVKECLRSRPWR